MKSLLLSISLLAAIIFANAQPPKTVIPVDPETKKATYFEVVDVAGATKDELYKRSKNFGTVSKENIVKDDHEAGIYSTKSKFAVVYQSPMKGMNHKGFVEYVLTVYAKEGKYKYVITDIIHTSEKGNGGDVSREIPECGKFTLTPGGWSNIKKATNDEVTKIIEGLKTGMRNPAKSSAASTDW